MTSGAGSERRVRWTRPSATWAGSPLPGTASQIQQLSAPQLPITTLSQFPTLQPEAEPARQIPNLAAGLGGVTFVGPQGAGFFKGGHNDMTGNTFVCVDQARRCVVILTDVHAALGETGVPCAWEYGEKAGG